MNRITAVQSSISDLFSNNRYQLDYYQRTYRWEQKHAQQLIDDLEEHFERAYQDGATIEAAAKYDEYFLGSVIIAQHGRSRYIVDGQQRLTTLLLVLIALHHRLPPGRVREDVTRLIAGSNERRPRFPLDIEDREACLRSLFRTGTYIADQKDRTARALSERYELLVADIERDINDTQVSAFATWLMNRVILVKIATESETDAYTIFETMNDRGLLLTPSEMLRGHLLSKITSPKSRQTASDAWMNVISRLMDLDEEVGRESIKPEDAIQAWLRGLHAKSSTGYSRETPEANRGDFEQIGNEFHRWVRKNSTSLSLDDEAAIVRFITRDFQFYADWYIRLQRAARELRPHLEDVRHVGAHSFNLQFMVLLSALRVGEREEISLRKIRIVSAYLDIRLHHRLWQGHGIGQTQMRDEMFRIARSLRGKSPRAIAKALIKELETETDFEDTPNLSLAQRNKHAIRVFLARLTCFAEEKVKATPSFDDYLTTGVNGFEIDHIIPNRFDKFRRHWENKRDFDEERGFIGGLVLVKTTVNRELGSKMFPSRRSKYRQENLLAASLDKDAYFPRSPIRSVNSRHSLKFKSYDRFGKTELHERQSLLKQVAEKIWSPDRIREAAES